MDVLIFANGDPPSVALAQRLAAAHSLVIAADGATDHLLRIGIEPHIVCGDFDSIDLASAQRSLPDTEFVPTPDQNAADLEKAILLARQRGATAITVVGAGGGRIDHTFANFSLLLQYGVEFPLTIVDDHSQVWGLRSTVQQPTCFALACTPGDTVSLISVWPETRVSITGVEWELSAFCLSPGTRGVSNVAAASEVKVELFSGALLLCHLPRTSVVNPPASAERGHGVGEERI